MTRSRVTVVVGGGCSGALSVIQLLRHTDDRVVLVEPRERVGRGLAYRTTEGVHLLNSRAGVMSARADDPHHFVSWCRARDGVTDAASFVPRRTYGAYLEEALDGAAARHPGRLRRVRARAERVLSEGRSTVVLQDGSVVRGDRAVLAVGHAPPADPVAVPPDVRLHPAYVADPWAGERLPTIARSAPVLLLGSGLTAVDVVLSLISRGHYGPIVALSRHGLLPAAHTAGAAPAMPPLSAPDPGPWGDGALRALVGQVRRRAAAAPDWRAVIDGLRPYVDGYWRALSPADQRRFVTHVGRVWEVHRHRMAPVVAAAIERLRATGAFTIMAGRVAGLAVDGTSVRVRAAAPDGRCREWTVGAVVNCTGPGCPTSIPLLANLVADGVVRTAGCGLGLDVDDEGRLTRPDGRPATTLHTIGPVRRGRWFETTAVPEIRAQAAALAWSDAGHQARHHPSLAA